MCFDQRSDGMKNHTIKKWVIALGLIVASMCTKADAINGDTTPPKRVVNPSYDEREGDIKITWTNPSDHDLAYVKILRNGTVVYQGLKEEFTDKGIDPYQNHDYTLIAVDTSQFESESVTLTYQGKEHPKESEKAVTAEEAVSEPVEEESKTEAPQATAEKTGEQVKPTLPGFKVNSPEEKEHMEVHRGDSPANHENVPFVILTSFVVFALVLFGALSLFKRH